MKHVSCARASMRLNRTLHCNGGDAELHDRLLAVKVSALSAPHGADSAAALHSSALQGTVLPLHCKPTANPCFACQGSCCTELQLLC